MKAIVIDKKHLTLVSHTNGVTIIEESGCIIDLDFQSLGSIFELADLGNTYTIKDCDEIESLKSDNNKLTERIEFLEKQLTNSGDRVTELRNQIIGLTSELNIRGQRISQLNDELNCRDKIIKEKTKRLIELENVEYELNKCRETNNALTEKLESKTIDLLDKASLYKYYRQAFRTVKEYLKPNEQYGFDSSGYNIINSINSKFVISFKDRSIASRAFNELRYSVSPRNVLVKYQKDIIEYNVDSMNIYFVENNTPNVVRKFHDESFSITCKDSYIAEIINILLNCGFDISGIMTTYKLYIEFSNIN